MKKQRGLAIACLEVRKRVASMGGKAAHAQGKVKLFNSKTGSIAGKKGAKVRWGKKKKHVVV